MTARWSADAPGIAGREAGPTDASSGPRVPETANAPGREVRGTALTGRDSSPGAWQTGPATG
jgi:hypothetical protein